MTQKIQILNFPLRKKKKDEEPIQIWQERNKIDIQETVVEIDEVANDFYNKYDPFEVTILDKEEFSRYRDSSVVEPREKEIYNANLNYYEPREKDNLLSETGRNLNYYEIKFSNVNKACKKAKKQSGYSCFVFHPRKQNHLGLNMKKLSYN